MRLAVVGSRGQLGAAVVREFSSGHDVCAFDRRVLDVTDPAAVSSSLDKIKPAAVINCTAYNAVDTAEDDPVTAFQVNAIAVRSLARAARRLNAAFVHFSTDFVFDGETNRPYTEEDRPNPRSVYAASKLVGEWFAADAEPAFVLRVESLFGTTPDGPAPRGSVAAIVNGLRAGSVVKVFEDRTISPALVGDIAKATRVLIERRAPAGLYHCVNSGRCTWLEFAEEAARLLGVEPRLETIRQASMRLRAKRPLYCAMSNAKLRAIGIGMPSWQDALARFLKQ